MVQGEAWMFHAHISLYLNCGLLGPRETIQAAEAAYKKGKAPLHSVEGFIRQILGWREFVRGLYWLHMPGYAKLNALRATRALPAFYWTAQTPMNCLKQCVQETQRNAYAHHIQRLMILGNFALLAGIQPEQVQQWFLSVYADAYEWVELPNVTGMALYADGGLLASKPYASSASYIAAPAAVRVGLPNVSISRSIAVSVGVTFPFNLAFGIPLYLELAKVFS
jgi:deoxyribodipyrimidine photolyase-related protein